MWNEETDKDKEFTLLSVGDEMKSERGALHNTIAENRGNSSEDDRTRRWHRDKRGKSSKVKECASRTSSRVRQRTVAIAFRLYASKLLD